jgi:hypothetical protein
LFDSIHMLHTSLSHTDRSPCLYLWEKARFCQTITLEQSKQDVRRYLQRSRLRPIRGEKALLARRRFGLPRWPELRELPRRAVPLGHCRADSARTVQIEAVCLAPLVGFDRGAGDLGVEGGDGGTQALRDHLRVMLESSLRIRVPEVALHVLNGRMALCVRRRRSAECLECEIVNPRFLC